MSRSHSTQILSSRLAKGEPTQAPAFWSKLEVSQSAASAAGVTPPTTKWKKRGPAERVPRACPRLASWPTAAGAPAPSSEAGHGARQRHPRCPGAAQDRRPVERETL